MGIIQGKNQCKKIRMIKLLSSMALIMYGGWILVGFSLYHSKKTNVKSYPEISVDDVLDGGYQKSFDVAVNDNFCCHSQLVKVHNTFLYTFFNEGIGDYIQGKKGFLFDKNDAFEVVSSQGKNESIEKYLAYAKSISELQNYLEKENKEFIYLITPSKAEVFVDYLPWQYRLIKKANGEQLTKHILLKKAFEEYGVNYYDITNDLREMRGQAKYDICSNTGHHWTISAAANEMNKVFEYYSMKKNVIFPKIIINGYIDTKDETDQDILKLQDVIFPRLAPRYNTPDLEYIHSMDSMYLFGTSYGGEIWRALCKNVQEQAFDSFIWQMYFTKVVIEDRDGERIMKYSSSDEPEDVGVMNYLLNSNLVMMEQQGLRGILDTHRKFVEFVLSNLEKEYCPITGSLISNSNAYRVSFYNPEEWGICSRGNYAAILIENSTNVRKKKNENVYLHIVANSYGINNTVEIMVNNESVKTVSLPSGGAGEQMAEYYIKIPEDLVNNESILLEFRLSQPAVSPILYGKADGRVIGMCIERLELVSGGSK